jgi:hypothetical protein
MESDCVSKVVPQERLLILIFTDIISETRIM